MGLDFSTLASIDIIARTFYTRRVAAANKGGHHILREAAAAPFFICDGMDHVRGIRGAFIFVIFGIFQIAHGSIPVFFQYGGWRICEWGSE